MNHPRVLHQSLQDSAERHPDKPAVICNDEALSYAQLYERSARVAEDLRKRGLRKGDRCIMFMDNSSECVTVLYAVFMAGGAAVVLNPQVKSEKLAYIADNCQARFAFVDGHLGATAASAGLDQRCAALYRNGVDKSGALDSALSLQTVALSASVDDAPAPVVSSDLALLIYTSGSTGEPKGVTHTHCSVMFSMGSIIEYLGMNGEDVTSLVLPMSFDYGLYQVLMSIHQGGTLVIHNSFIFPAQVFKGLERHSVTVFPAVPTIFSMMVGMHRRKPMSFPGVRMITSTAADLPAAIIPELQQIFPNARIFKMYGLTECKRVSYLDPELISVKPESVGKPMPGIEVFILDEQGREVPVGETGVLHVRGCNLMLGYWGDEAMTRRALVDGIYPGDRMLCTGDLFRQDEDGDLYFIGRQDDIIKTRGEKVSPLEVENILLKLPGVREAAVIGQEDDILGQVVVAFVVAEPDAGLTEKAILKACSAQLEKYMVPQRVVFLDAMPLSRTGKIDKGQLG